jgi:hypothetical protein
MGDDLADVARRHVESMVARLEGENDFRPFLTLNGAAAGHVYLSLDMPDRDHPKKKDDVGDVIAAVLAAYRASEAVFCSVTWAVFAKRDEKLGEVAPSDDPRRVEMVFMLQVDLDKGDTFHNAEVIRRDGRVSLGTWEASSQQVRASGRFGDAMHMGMTLGADMPEAMTSYIDAQLRAGDEMKVLRPMINALRQFRKGVQK